jgi:hypothetical protein
MLTGADLLAKVKELGDVSKSELVRSCGYVSTKRPSLRPRVFTSVNPAAAAARGDASSLTPPPFRAMATS